MREDNAGGRLGVRLINIALVVPVVILAVVALFASQEIVLTLAAPVIADQASDSTRAKYALVSLRNFWLIAGGMLALGVMILSLDRLVKDAGKLKTRRLLLRILLVELAIVAGRMLIAP